MTDRHAGYIVTLERDIREDDAETILTALRQVRGVLTVEPVIADGLSEYMGSMRERARWEERIFKLLEQSRDE